MTKYLKILPFTALTMLAMLFLSNAASANQVEQSEITVDLYHGSITHSMYSHIGDHIIVKLKSGDDVKGVLDSVGTNYSFITKVANPGDYYATVISNQEIAAVTFRVVSEQGEKLPMRVIFSGYATN